MVFKILFLTTDTLLMLGILVVIILITKGKQNKK